MEDDLSVFTDYSNDEDEEYEFAETKKDWERRQSVDSQTRRTPSAREQIDAKLNQDATEEAITQLICSHPVEFEKLLLAARTQRGIEKISSEYMKPHIVKTLESLM